MFSAPDSWDFEHGRVMDSREHVTRILRSLREVFARRRALRRLAPRFACDLPVVLLPPDGTQIAARVVDISHAGVGISVTRDELFPEGTELALTISWNEYERTTFHAEAVHVRGEHGGFHVGLTFMRLDGQQNEDLIKHVYTRLDALEAERKVA
jgi:c-di-GMP-binding flagellar brake protein YcgR